jgi:hypothetical protein
MLVGVLCSLLVCRACNIEQTIDARLHSVCALVSKLDRLFRVCSVFVDHFVNEILDRRDVLRSA